MALLIKRTLGVFQARAPSGHLPLVGVYRSWLVENGGEEGEGIYSREAVLRGSAARHSEVLVVLD